MRTAVAFAEGLERKPDGTLLTWAEEQAFDLILIVDQRILSQQNLQGREVALVVLENARRPIVRRYVRRIALAVRTAGPGTSTLVQMPRY